ncbi:MAG TPA: glutamate--cysteine ligase, partial [Gammaproteobacteria bacterium]|nr:glutamate--cysteine ligase [Gammaproteobacteria bacterium]
VERFCPKACGILVIPESHTRNTYYLENLAGLVNLLELSGFQANIGTLIPDIVSPQTLDLPSGRQITLNPLTRDGNKLTIGTHTPCFILLNNDLSSGVPDILKNLDQPVAPPTSMGW